MKQICSLFLSLSLLVALPGWSQSSLFGVARGSGEVAVNGAPFPQERNVYSGDRFTTGPDGALTLIGSSQERVRMGPQTKLSVQKAGEERVFSLEQGVMNFETAGGSRAIVAPYGIEIRPRERSSTVAQVAYFGPQKGHVAALRGSVEVVNAGETTLLNEGEAVTLTAVQEEGQDDEGKPKGAKYGAGLSPREKAAIVLAVLGGIAAVVIPLTVGRGGGEEEVVSPATVP